MQGGLAEGLLTYILYYIYIYISIVPPSRPFIIIWFFFLSYRNNTNIIYIFYHYMVGRAPDWLFLIYIYDICMYVFKKKKEKNQIHNVR